MKENSEMSHDILLTVLDSLDAIVYVADIQTYELLFLNKYARNIFGDSVGKLCWQVLQKNRTAPCDFCTNIKLISDSGKIKGVYAWELQNTVNNRWYDIRDRAINWIDDRIVRLEIATDITERKQIENRLKREKDFSERLIASSVDGILAFDRNCCYTIWNPGMERISGKKKAEVAGKHAFDIFPFLKETGEDKVFFDALAGNSVVTDDRPYHVEETGQKGFFKGFYSPIRDDSGEIIGGLGVIHDITKRKKAEEKLKTNEAHLHSLLQNIQAAVVVHGPDTMIIECNKLSQELLGLTEDQMLGKAAIDPMWRFFNEDGSDMPSEHYPVNRVIATKNALENFVAGVYRPNKNDVKYVLINAYPEVDHDDNISHVIVTFMDITEYRRIEEEMRVLSKFPSENPNPVLRVRKDGTILYGNGASKTLLKIWKCQLGQRMPDDWCELILDTLNSGESQKAEIKHEERITSLSFTPVSDAGYVNIYGQDITERKRAEAERENIISELQKALKEVKSLRGILPLCSFCKKIRDDTGYWEKVDVYIHKYSQADISHSVCPECAKKHYPDLDLYKD